MSRTPQELALKSLTDWWTDAGAPPEMTMAALLRDIARPAPSAPEASNRSKKPESATPTPRRLRIDPVAEAGKAARAAGDIQALKAACAGFEGCDLRRSARNLVFNDGVPSARVMIVGEAPGRDEDREGKPFVGATGALLDRMFAAIGLNRQDSLYLTYTVFWHPPGNRDPSAEETAICAPFLHRQIELVKPAVIVAVGKFAAKTLLRTNEGAMKLRGRRMAYEQAGLPVPVPCIPMLDPAYLLKRPADKALAWKDLLLVRSVLNEAGA